MDLLGALPDEVFLEVYDDGWVETVDYEHILFICCNVMSMETYSEIVLLIKGRNI